MSDVGTLPLSPWALAVIDDDVQARETVAEYFKGELLESRPIEVVCADFHDAASKLRSRAIDFVILDLFEGPMEDGRRTGDAVLQQWKDIGYAPVVVYTGAPEQRAGADEPFVRTVSKDQGVDGLMAALVEFVGMKVPGVHKQLETVVRDALNRYMWRFVSPEWNQSIRPVASGPDLSRLLIRRLAQELSRSDLGGAVQGWDVVHPVECYIKPPLATHPLLGDIRVRVRNGHTEYFILLWPSCDLVNRPPARQPKTERVLCAKADLLEDTPEWQAWAARGKQKDGKDVKAIVRLLRNQRDTQFGSLDRYHYLPHAWDIPDLVVDFQAVEVFSFSEVERFVPLATVASPYAEVLSSRFFRYLGRLGQPDLNLDIVTARISSD